MSVLFDLFFVVDKSGKCLHLYPEDSHEFKEKSFLYPCNDFGKFRHDLYIMVFTDITGTKNYVLTKYINNENLSLGIKSINCWWELYYCIMNNIINDQLYKSKVEINKYFQTLIDLPPPEPGLVMYIPSYHFDKSATKVSIPEKCKLRPFQTFMESLFKYMKFENWIIILESILLEKWIVFHSNYFHRVTNCLFAMLTLIFPLEWVHLVFPCLSKDSVNCLGCPTPFIAGIHSCLLEETLMLLNPGTVIVDIDKGEVNYVLKQDSVDENEDDFIHLPRSLVNYLNRSYREFEVKNSNMKNKNMEVEKLWFNLCSSFLNVISILIGKYSKFKQFDKDKNKYVIDKVRFSRNIPQFEQFLSQMLESQMVHQFLDTKLNPCSIIEEIKQNPNKTTFKITINDVDDFAESCKAVSKWIPDQYAERIANFTSISREKINVFTAKVQKTIQTRKVPTDQNSIFYLSQIKQKSLTSDDSDNFVNISRESLKLNTNESKSSTTIIRPARTDWVTFDDDFESKLSISEIPVKSIHNNQWSHETENPSQFAACLLQNNTDDDYIVQNTEADDVFLDLSSNKRDNADKNRVTSIIRDFDPLYG